MAAKTAKKTTTKKTTEPKNTKKLIQEESTNSITLNTVLFKDMVARAKKGAVNNSILPITSMMAIELKDNKLTLMTTDTTNYLYVMQDVEGPDFYVTVIADTFAALVAKTTSEKITLELKDNYLEFIGNGKYSIELPTEEGEVIKFPDARNVVELEPLKDIKLSTVNSIISTAKPSLAVTMEDPAYTNYYCGEKVLATDGLKICCMDKSLWEEPRLISPQLMELVSLITSEDIKVSAADDIIMFSTPSCQVFGRTMSGIDDYSVDDILNVVDTEFASSCTIKKQDILQLLDRLSLFVAKNDNNEIYLTFTKDGLQISSKASSGVEIIKYVNTFDFTEFTCVADIEMLTAEVKALTDDNVHISYGGEVDTAIKFEEGDTKVLVGLLEDDRTEE